LNSNSQVEEKNSIQGSFDVDKSLAKGKQRSQALIWLKTRTKLEIGSLNSFHQAFWALNETWLH
jgi:hypothetical protein